MLSAIENLLDVEAKESYDSALVKAKASKLASTFGEYENSQNAGRMLIYDVTRPCGDTLGYTMVMEERLSKDIYYFMRSNAEEIDRKLSSTEDREYLRQDYFSATTAIKSYMLRPYFDEDPMESPNQMWMRIAVQLYWKYGIRRVFECYDELSQGYYIHASPTIFNSGTKRPQMSSCFLITIQDDLSSILYDGVGDAGMISRLNGGLGISIGRIRHSQISNVGRSSGVMPVGRIYDRSTVYVDQGGKRAGACTLFLPIQHIDCEDFITATDNYKDHHLRFEKVNTCMWMHRLFFDRAEKGENWTVFCPAKAESLYDLNGLEFEMEYIRMEKEAELKEKEYQLACENLVLAKEELIKACYLGEEAQRVSRRVYANILQQKIKASKSRIEHKTYNANKLLKTICKTQIRSGSPYVMHADSINAKSNQCNIGSVQGSNLCLEITEVTPTDSSGKNQIASCNLASINMAAYVKDLKEGEEKVDRYDFNLYGAMMRKIVENLDSVIDENYYPLGQDGKGGKIGILNHQTRPLGIGVSGYADAVQAMDMIYDSEETDQWNRKVFACGYFNAMASSIQLAITKGEYPTFRTGSYQEYSGYTMESGVKKPFYTEMNGSPLSNGRFQFDLWEIEAQKLADFGKLDQKIYDRSLDRPIPPSEWGQHSITLHLKDETTHVIEPTWESLREAVVKFGVRNSLLIALMPTASSAQLLTNTETTELPQSNIYSRQTQSGNFTVVNKHMSKDLANLGLWTPEIYEFLSACKGSLSHLKQFVKDHPDTYPNNNPKQLDHLIKKYKTMFEVSQKTIIKQAASRARYVCQSQSMNVYIAAPSIKVLQALHSYTNKIGLKTGMYYLRQNPPSFYGDFNLSPKILQYCTTVGVTVSKQPEEKKDIPAEKAPMMCRMEAGCISCE